MRPRVERAELQLLEARFSGLAHAAVCFAADSNSTPQTFRTTRAGALAYFVGGDPSFPKDTGFALKGWRKADVNNAAIFIAGDVASSIGNVSITDKDGKVTTVDKTWTFLKDDSGKLRIVVHHSSLPYRANRVATGPGSAPGPATSRAPAAAPCGSARRPGWPRSPWTRAGWRRNPASP